MSDDPRNIVPFEVLDEHPPTLLDIAGAIATGFVVGVFVLGVILYFAIDQVPAVLD
jgi:hypothetical protein